MRARKYQELYSWLVTEKRVNKGHRTINGNVVFNVEGEDVVLTYHHTDILKYSPDGSIKVDNGGWGTNSTRRWLNYYSPKNISFHQSKFVQYIRQNGFDPEPFEECVWLKEIEEGLYDILTDIKKKENDKNGRR